MKLLDGISVIFITLSHTISAAHCDPPSPAFFPPDLSLRQHAQKVAVLHERLTSAVSTLINDPIYNATSFSISLTSTTSTFLSLHHSALVRSPLFHGGAANTTNLTNFRIASITKTFTVLALLQLQESGLLNLDASILAYLPHLNNSGILPWKDITSRSLASQQAGLPRDYAQDDTFNYSDRDAALGLPKLNASQIRRAHLPTCDEYANYTRACNESEFLDFLVYQKPTFAPNQHASYSNVGFDLLGLVIAAVANSTYEEYVTDHILRPLGLTHGTSFSTPKNEVAAIPAGDEQYWNFEIGVQNPTGGLYSNTADMGIWLRYVLSTYNAHAHGALNWIAPFAYSGGIRNFYGLPWEIMRVKTREMGGELESERALTLVTKGGGLPGYTSDVVMVPELGVGVTMLVAGHGRALFDLREVVMREVVEVAERVAIEGLKERYMGVYEDEDGNSTMELRVSEKEGLYIEQWVSNGVDVKKNLGGIFTEVGERAVLHVVPLQLYIEEKKQKGERWRVVMRKESTDNKGSSSVWNDQCVEDWQVGLYVGEVINELIFWEFEKGQAVDIELPAYRKTLKKTRSDKVVAHAITHTTGQVVLEI